MKNYLVFPSDDGGEIIFQIESPESAGVVRASRGDNNTTLADVSIQHAVDKARLLTNVMTRTLRGVMDPPDELEVQFGMSMEKFGAAISQDVHNANVVVILRWRASQTR